jgi:oxygen-independent coproporphyrinogen-3 oxidase
MFQFHSLPPLSLYIHVPWCVRKCPYCDFNSHALQADIPEQEYVDALLSDLEHDLPRTWGRSVQTVFIGGGTPSLLSPEAFDRLLSGLRARLTLYADAEITLEANPGTFEAGKFAEFRDTGINRLSIGIQSFNNTHLEKLGRIHDSKQAVRAAEIAHDAGFDNFNLDLMFGLPMQSIEQAEADLRQAISLEPSHLSWYQLTIEPNTLFHHSPPLLPNDELIADMAQHGQDLLAEHGFGRYEVSAYAKDNKQSRHNLNYWQFGDYLGIGAGAHAKISDAAQQNITRLWKHKQPADYMQRVQQGTHIGGENVLTRHDAVVEFMMNALRLKDGFATAIFEANTGLGIVNANKGLELAEEKGLIERDMSHVKPTQRGYNYLNDLVGLFLEEQ